MYSYNLVDENAPSCRLYQLEDMRLWLGQDGEGTLSWKKILVVWTE